MQYEDDESEEVSSIQNIGLDPYGHKEYQTDQIQKTNHENVNFNFMSQQKSKEFSKEDFGQIVDRLKSLENNFTKVKYRKTIKELQEGIDNLFSYRDYLDQLKNHTVKRIENLSQIEISLFERELSLDTKLV